MSRKSRSGSDQVNWKSWRSYAVLRMTWKKFGIKAGRHIPQLWSQTGFWGSELCLASLADRKVIQPSEMAIQCSRLSYFTLMHIQATRVRSRVGIASRPL